MQVITLEIEDDYVADFISYVGKFKEKVSVKKDPNLESDPYFHERRKKLHQLSADIDSGKVELIPWDQFKDELGELEKSLKEN